MTWAKTCVGVVSPVANAIDIPKAMVRSITKRPVRIGRLFRYERNLLKFFITIAARAAYKRVG